MKQIIYLFTFLLSTAFMVNTASAQGVSMNTTGIAADASSMLDVASTTKGMLVPRMDSAQRAAISSPATGLMVYQTDGVTPGFYNYNGSVWQKVGATVQPHVQVFTSSGTFTTSSNITAATVFKITLIGAGGGGGGGFITGAGGGGGAGANAVYWGSGLSANTGYTVTVGAGGNSGFATSNGVNGGTSSVVLGAVTVSCSGGIGGTSGFFTGAGGSGGAASGGTLNAGGGSGANGVTGSSGSGGAGSSSIYGGGGNGGVGSGFGPGSNGTGSGSGGGGGGGEPNIGGNGAPGIAIIEWSE